MSEKVEISKKSYSSKMIFTVLGSVLLSVAILLIVAVRSMHHQSKEEVSNLFYDMSQRIISFHNSEVEPVDVRIKYGLLVDRINYDFSGRVRVQAADTYKLVDYKTVLLAKKPLVLMKFKTIRDSNEVENRSDTVTLAYYAIADRSFPVAKKFSSISYVWKSYTWKVADMSLHDLPTFAHRPYDDEVNMVVTNFTNDYFLMIVGSKSSLDLTKHLNQMLILPYSMEN